MEIQKILEKINEIYSDFSLLFKSFPKSTAKNTTNNDKIITKTDLKNEMIFLYQIQLQNEIRNLDLSKEKEFFEISDKDFECYVDYFLSLMFDEVKKIKIIRPKKTWKR